MPYFFKLLDVQAVAAAKEAWGSKRLEELDAEERLSFACEKAATEDRITLMLRSAFKVASLQLSFLLEIRACGNAPGSEGYSEEKGEEKQSVWGEGGGGGIDRRPPQRTASPSSSARP